MLNYPDFLQSKTHTIRGQGFRPSWMPDAVFPFQQRLIEEACSRERYAVFADCGLGKTLVQLAFAENVVRHTNGRALIVTPLSVSAQTVREGAKFGVDVKRSVDGQAKGSITVTNYEKLHLFDRGQFSCVILDESSTIKNFDGVRKGVVTEFMREVPYRLLCTATAAPNDYIELGTSSEALGELGRMDMLARYFKNDENSLHPIWWGARWRLKRHGEHAFWAWVASWSRALRRPSDIGFSDEGFVLPGLNIQEHIVHNNAAFHGQLFPVQAVTLEEQREERRMTLVERCTRAAETLDGKVAVAWCHLNAEADTLERMMAGSRQISGSMADEEKEELYDAFSSGQLRQIVLKPRMGAFGMNWQHCHNTSFFPSHSFEQWYQGVRRFWRFGQTKPVNVHIVTTEGELGVMRNLQRKAEAASHMFDMIVQHMNEAVLDAAKPKTHTTEAPSWL